MTYNTSRDQSQQQEEFRIMNEVNSSTINDHVFSSTSTKKEQMLKKLLESQETYIQELEMKNKDLREQVFQNQAGTTTTNQNLEYMNQLNIDMNTLQRSDIGCQDKLQYLIEQLPRNSIFVQALQSIKNSLIIEIQLIQDQAQFNESLSRTQQISNQKEKQDIQKAVQEIEVQYRSQVRNLEKEIKLLRDLAHESSDDKENDMKREMIVELEKLQLTHKRSEDDLRKENLMLKIKLDQALGNIEELQSFVQSQQSQFEMELMEKEHKWILEQETMRQLLKETLIEFKKQKLSKNTQLAQQISEQVEDYLKNHNSNDKLQPELENQKLKNKEIESALKEVNLWKEKVDKQEIQMLEVQKAWEDKLKVLNNEKRALQEELKEFIRITSQRESQLEKENASLKQSNQKILGFSETREKMQQEELTQIKAELRKINLTYNRREMEYLKEKDVFQNELTEYQEIVDQIHTQFENLKKGQGPTESGLLKKQIENLQRQLNDANKLLGRNTSSKEKLNQDQQAKLLDSYIQESKNQIGGAIQKYESLINEISNFSSKLASNSNEDPNKKLIENLMNQVQNLTRSKKDQDSQNFETLYLQSKEEQVKVKWELDHAKRNLVNYITSVKQLEQAIQQKTSNAQAQQLIVEKFNTEIKRLNEENSSLFEQKNQMQVHYQQECQRLWISNKQLDEEKQEALKQLEQSNLYVIQLKHQLEQQGMKFQELMVKLQTAYNGIQQLSQKQLQDFEAIRKQEIRVLQEQMKQLIEDFQKQTTQKKGQININKERDLLQEEISILRDQLSTFEKNYQSIMELRNQEYQALSKERETLNSIEVELKEQVLENEKIQQVLDDFNNKKGNFMRYQEDEVIQDLNNTISILDEKFQTEKRLYNQEIISMNKGYQQKLINLKENEAVKDFELGKQKKEIQFLQTEYKEYKQIKEDLVMNQRKELERLRRFMNDRQQENMTNKQKIGEQMKKMKEIVLEKDKEMNQVKNNNINKYLNVINSKINR